MDEISSVTHVGSWVDHGIMTSVVSAIKRHIKGKKTCTRKGKEKGGVEDCWHSNGSKICKMITSDISARWLSVETVGKVAELCSIIADSCCPLLSVSTDPAIEYLAGQFSQDLA